MSGEKISTWRLWDEKDLSVNDIVEFIEYGTDKLIAVAKLTKVIEKPLGKLTDEDKEGHEKFETPEKMYETYSKYYGKTVNSETIVKIIWFELMT